MKSRSRAVAVCSMMAAIVLSILSPTGVRAEFVRDEIGAKLSQEDGSTISLTCIRVLWRGRSGKSLAVEEWDAGVRRQSKEKEPRVILISTSQLPAEPGWSISCTGRLSTIEGKRVAILDPGDVTVYCDRKSGKPYPPCPNKQFAEQMNLLKRPLSDFQTGSKMSVLSEELPSLPDDPEPLSFTPAAGSKDSLKHLPDGAPVSVNGAIVSASFSQSGFFYVEKSDRSFGIWINSNTWVSNPLYS